MCTVTSVKPIKHIAEEDIITYKGVNIEHFRLLGINLWIKGFSSEIRTHYYKKNVVYTTRLDPFKVEHIRYFSGSGFYSWESPSYANVKCIIPKGSEYYLVCDETSFEWIYTSNQIKIVSVL